MRRSDDHLEHLISRKLDGELTEGESLELDKRLIRDPAVRQSLEESERIDRLTTALLEEVCAVQDEALAPTDVPAPARRRLWWFGASPAAAAACVALFFAWPMFAPQPPDSNLIPDGGPIGLAPAEDVPSTRLGAPGPAEGSAKLASYPDLRPLREHGTRLNYYGVLDPETQKLYLLEVKHQTSMQRPNQLRQRGASRGGVRLASSDM